VQQNRPYSELPRDRARVLAPRPAEHDESMVAHIVAACHADAPDGFGHAAVGDFEESFGDLLDAAYVASLAQLARELLERSSRALGVQCKHEAIRLQASEQQVRVGQGWLSRFRVAVTEWSRSRPSALGSDTQPMAIVATERSTAGGYGVDEHHRCSHLHARHFGLVHTFQLAFEARHVRRRAAHVETDDAWVARSPRNLRESHDAAGWTGQDGAGTSKAQRVHEAAARLHDA
jgi:hypothetical protein